MSTNQQVTRPASTGGVFFYRKVLAMKMLVSLDGGVTYQDVRDGVRVLYEDVLIPGEDEQGQLLLNCTEEGLIQDVWVTRDDADHNIGTSSATVDELVDRLVEDD